MSHSELKERTKRLMKIADRATRELGNLSVVGQMIQDRNEREVREFVGSDEDAKEEKSKENK